ncbi:MAG: hypothetical protein WCH39_08135 [Schlesneria sp.]
MSSAAVAFFEKAKEIFARASLSPCINLTFVAELEALLEEHLLTENILPSPVNYVRAGEKLRDEMFPAYALAG